MMVEWKISSSKSVIVFLHSIVKPSFISLYLTEITSIHLSATILYSCSFAILSVSHYAIPTFVTPAQLDTSLDWENIPVHVLDCLSSLIINRHIG